jgi:hypothetical protein
MCTDACTCTDDKPKLQFSFTNNILLLKINEHFTITNYVLVYLKHSNLTHHHTGPWTSLTKCFHLQNIADADINTVLLHTYVGWFLFLGRFNDTSSTVCILHLSNYSTIKHHQFRSCHIKTHLKEIGWELDSFDTEWEQWQAALSTVMKCQIPYTVERFTFIF